MAFDENSLHEQVKSLQAQLTTAKAQYEPILERYQNFKTNMGVKEKADGSLVIDYEKFAERLGAQCWLELRKVGDEIHRVTGANGEKPRVRVAANAA
ncbi:MAG: hypothetical protein NUW21_07620 [Elusimicrobia bacterium]|nr:hypothetical protein [Elusimicrobiota bacterium]